MKWLHFISEAV